MALYSYGLVADLGIRRDDTDPLRLEALKRIPVRMCLVWQLFGACRRRTPRARSNRRVASERARSALSDATLRFDLALGVRRRHAPKVAKNRNVRRRRGRGRALYRRASRRA